MVGTSLDELVGTVRHEHYVYEHLTWAVGTRDQPAAFDLPYLHLAQVLHAKHSSPFSNVQAISARLYTAGLPDPDLLIRTSGELRLSNFLLWQINGCKVYFTDRPWPDFDAAELDRALALLDGNG